MRILMLGSKEYPFGVSAGHDPKAGGGIEFHVEKLSKYLARRGHEVFIITRRFPGQPYRETAGNIHVYRTSYAPNKYLRAFTFNLLGFFMAPFLIRKHRIDLIHSHAVMAGFFGAVLSRLTGRPMLLTPHGTVVGWGFPVREILRFFQRASLKGAGRTIFISGPAREALAPLTRHHALLSNAIDLEDYDFKSIPSREMRFLFLGRLEEVKGADILIEAFSRLLKRCPRARLMIAGEGSIKPRIIDLILKAKTEMPHPPAGRPEDERIRYMGWMNPREALKASDVFVLPSTEKGQPVALLEAMASGKIIITSLPFIKPGRTGLSCRPNSQDLCRKMLMVCRSPGRYRRLGRQAREEARSLGWESAVILFEKEYQKALQGNRSNATYSTGAAST
jgi:glycosyltransferase involved in cell wall biosynthesis